MATGATCSRTTAPSRRRGAARRRNDGSRLRAPTGRAPARLCGRGCAAGTRLRRGRTPERGSRAHPRLLARVTAPAELLVERVVIDREPLPRDRVDELDA